MRTRQQLIKYYGRELTDEEVTAEQKLIYETDEILEGTGLKHDSQVRTKDGEGFVYCAGHENNGDLYIGVSINERDGIHHRHYLLKDVLEVQD